ncbi:MAG TPA: HAMP domain-containing sensor histidine kinase [Puia sp.]|nr:HAMP domain-containing sensor histidine kinase [Puia sp.]
MSQPLEQRNTRVLMTWLPLVMLAGSVFFYLIVIGHIRHMKQQQLLLKQKNVWNAFVRDPLGLPRSLAGEYTISRNGRSYVVTTYISAKEYRHLLIKIGIAEATIFVVLLITIFIVNRRASVRLWRPFYSTMKAVRGYDIRRNTPLLLDADTGIEEFNRLNQTLLALIDHVDQAYRNQKQFTENASHELQTPLAIIRSKVELLMEGAGLDEDSAQLLQEITEANERLSQMNKNLLLLTRIENGMFPEVEPIALSALVGRLSDFFREYHEDEAIRTQVSIHPDVTIAANPALIEVLVGNLLRNAYIHNLPNGWVHVELSDKALIIENSGPVLDADPERLFDRFRKGRVDNRTTGLGLALVRQIAQLYQYEMRYTYGDGKHRLWVLFRRGDATGYPK